MNAKKPKVTYGISTSMLFDMREPDAIYRNDGPEAYAQHMIENQHSPLPHGPWFEALKRDFEDSNGMIEVVLASRNSPITARRALKTLGEHGITPARMFFTCGKSPVPYLKAYGIDLFRTTDLGVAQEALANDVLVAHYDPVSMKDIQDQAAQHAAKSNDKNVVTLPASKVDQPSLRSVYNGRTLGNAVFDLDGVVFGAESEHFYKQFKLAAYHEHEKNMRDIPLSQGPAFNLLKKYTEVNKQYAGSQLPFEISVVTARGDFAAIRAIETLHAWGIDIEGTTHFLGGAPKKPVLDAIRAHAAARNMPAPEFWDDQQHNIQAGHDAGVLTGYIPQDYTDHDPKSPG